MENNVVVFGPAHAGKSTLIGYLYVNYTKEFDFEQFKQKCQTDSWYDEGSKYAYLLDQTVRERWKGSDLPRNEQKKGTSLYVHFKPISLESGKEILFIDTPGMPFKLKEKTKGLFFGDIGIFMVECKNIKGFKFEKLKEDRAIITEFLTPLLLWSKFQSKDQKLLVLLSKMDEVNFSQESYETSKNVIKKICTNLKIEIDDIIPIFIDVPGEVDETVIKISENMNWYSGPTLVNKLTTLLKSIPTTNQEKPLLVSLDPQMFKIDGIGHVLRGKVLQGELNVGDVIKIEPISYKGKTESLLATVRSLKKERGPHVQTAQEGDIVGINVTTPTISHGKRCYIKDCIFVKTSLIVNKELITKQGDVMELIVPSKGNENIYSHKNEFRLNDNIQVIWLGRFVNSEIIDLQTTNGDQLIRLKFINNVASIPLSKDNTYCFKQFILKKGDEIFSAYLRKFGFDVDFSK